MVYWLWRRVNDVDEHVLERDVVARRTMSAADG
jgi:hypothetical protein